MLETNKVQMIKLLILKNMMLIMHGIKLQMKMLYVKKRVLRAMNMFNNKLERNISILID